MFHVWRPTVQTAFEMQRVLNRPQALLALIRSTSCDATADLSLIPQNRATPLTKLKSSSLVAQLDPSAKEVYPTVGVYNCGFAKT